jgi:DNA-binding LacI/PurR family transcriptional regulator
MARNPETNTLTPPPPRTSSPTIATIAAHMGVSRATVTHVLNGRAVEMRIRPETQRRVLEVARELGYRANTSARAIRAGRFGNIALVQSLLGQYLPNELLHGLTQAIADKDLHLVLTQVSDAVIEEETYLPHTMRDLSVDGVLINRHVGPTLPYLERIRRLQIPAAFLNVKQEFDCVYPDDRAGGRMAAEFLLCLGHERIAYVDTEEPENKHYSKEDRRSGYEQAMLSAGKPPWRYFLPKDWQMAGQPSMDQRVESARLLLARDDRPTAVIAYELAEAMAVVRAAYVLRLRIPEDLSLIQFHHWVDDRFFVPIHTVSNAMEMVGINAVDLLLEKIERPEVPLPARVVPVTMLDGATCLPPRP